jgi:RNA polymerase sigma-70 factor (ECF subfamily)
MHDFELAAEKTLGSGFRILTELSSSRALESPQEQPVTFQPGADNVAVAERALTFHELYERYATDVYRFAHWLTGNPEDARDITSETFVRAWTADAEPRGETVKAYLFTIARNLHRKAWRRTSRLEPIVDDFVDPAARPDVAAADREELDRAMAAIRDLPELDRTVLLLRVHDNMSYQEIAAITGISIAAAKVKVFRARSRLAARLQSEL